MLSAKMSRYLETQDMEATSRVPRFLVLLAGLRNLPTVPSSGVFAGLFL